MPFLPPVISANYKMIGLLLLVLLYNDETLPFIHFISVIIPARNEQENIQRHRWKKGKTIDLEKRLLLLSFINKQ